MTSEWGNPFNEIRRVVYNGLIIYDRYIHGNYNTMGGEIR